MKQIMNPLDYPICLAKPLHSEIVSTWIEHVPFGMFLIDVLRPKVLVELGTNKGCSYLSFCQAVQQLSLDTQCFAVDTWQGDLHTGAYGENVLANLQAYHDPLYGTFSHLMQGTFDEALPNFSDGSIDLLHIDGFHTYEAVKHDFETWLPKLSKHAVVLFHDTNVHERDFGVWKLWAELQPKYPTFEFFHGYGLGVLWLEREPSAAALESLFEMSDEQAERLRTFFFTLGSRFPSAASKQETNAKKKKDAAAMQELVRQKTALENQLKAIHSSKAWKLVTWWRRIRHG